MDILCTDCGYDESIISDRFSERYKCLNNVGMPIICEGCRANIQGTKPVSNYRRIFIDIKKEEIIVSGDTYMFGKMLQKTFQGVCSSNTGPRTWTLPTSIQIDKLFESLNEPGNTEIINMKKIHNHLKEERNKIH